MEDLPPEIIAAILAFVPPICRARSRRVCSRFRDMMDFHPIFRQGTSEMKKAISVMDESELQNTMRMAIRVPGFSLDEFMGPIVRFVKRTKYCGVDFSKPYVFQHCILPAGTRVGWWKPFTVLNAADGHSVIKIPIVPMLIVDIDTDNKYIFHTVPLKLSIETEREFKMDGMGSLYYDYFVLRESDRFTTALQMTITMLDGEDHIIFVMQVL